MLKYLLTPLVFIIIGADSILTVEASAQTNNTVADFIRLYDAGSAPMPSDTVGWFSGHCYHTDPLGSEIGAVLAFVSDPNDPAKSVKFIEFDKPSPNAFVSFTPEMEQEVNGYIQQVQPVTQITSTNNGALGEPVCINGPGNDHMSPYTHGAYLLLKKSDSGFVLKIVSLAFSHSCQETQNAGVRTKGYCYFDKKLK